MSFIESFIDLAGKALLDSAKRDSEEKKRCERQKNSIDAEFRIMSERIVHVQTVLQESRAAAVLAKAKAETGATNMKDALSHVIDVYLGELQEM